MRWKKKEMNDSGLVPKLINYVPEQIEALKEIAEETNYSFTEVQKMINEYFLDGEEDTQEVFGESEDDEDEDED
tara:strand:- start:296 stop:517 length:222 start_codon:yes stop_codon:yes gene_type:complete